MRACILLLLLLALSIGACGGADKVTSCEDIVRAGDARSVLLVGKQLSAEGWIYQTNRSEEIVRAVLAEDGDYPHPERATCRVHIVPGDDYEYDTYVTVTGKITGISYDMVWGGYDIYVDD